MSEKKKPNGIQLLIRAVVTDPNGKVLSDTGQKPSKSFVIQFLEFLYYLFWASGVGNQYATATDGTEDPLWNYDYLPNNAFSLNAPVNVSTYGLVVGTGNTAPTNINYKLATQLTEGVGAGNITHGAVLVGNAEIVGANVDLVVKRSFVNNTGSTITAKEVGAYARTYYQYNPWPSYYFCIIRDVLGAPTDIPDKCSLTVYYTFRTTV